MKYKFIIWDWNGTLLDDVCAALGSVNDMLEMRGMKPIDLVRYRECIGVPIRKFYEQVFDLEKEDYNLIIKQYNEGYARRVLSSRLTDRVPETLGLFARAGARQIIVSSSHNDVVLNGVERFGIRGYFDEILGAGDYFAASKIDRARAYLEKNGAKSGEVLVIGDLEHDAEMAREIGADCVLLTSGHEMPERLRTSGAVAVDSLREIDLIVD